MSALEDVVRDEWGRLLALLVAQYRRLDLAEEGLADAVEAAARTWPADEPANPAGWLLTAARRRIVDRLRSEAVLARRMPLLAVEADVTEEAHRTMADPGDVPEALRDERLRLVLLCADPLLSREAAAALTLRLVLGVSTEDLAHLFLQSTATMAARLTRAKRRLTGASFTLPSGPELAERLGVVADVAYLAFTAGYAPPSGPDAVRAELAGEAIRLVRVVRRVLPAPDPEMEGLLALMLLQHSRRRARVDAAGVPVLLPDQDRSRWDRAQVAEALALLTPLVHAPPAPYLLQALIAAEHAIAASAEATAWNRIVERYDELLTLQDTPVVRLNRAVAVAEACGPKAGLAALESVALRSHRLPAVRGELLDRCGRSEEARDAFATAIALCDNAAERRALEARLRRV